MTDTVLLPNFEGPVTYEELYAELSKLFAPRSDTSSSYRDFEFTREGGTKVGVRATHGIGSQRIMFVHKQPSNQRAKRHLDRGYNSAHELKVLRLLSSSGADAGDRYRLAELVEFEQDRKLGVVTVYKYHDDPSLEQRVQEEGPLSALEADNFFGHVLESSRNLYNDHSVLHRDIKPTNVLVKDTVHGLEPIIVDLANATTTKDVTAKTIPTVGGSGTTDPRVFNDAYGANDAVQSEMFALGATLYYAVTGKHMFRTVFDEENNGEGNQVLYVADGKETKLPMVDGKVDPDAFRKYKRRGLSRLHWMKRSYRGFLSRAMSLGSEVGDRPHFESLDDMVSAFGEASDRKLWETHPHQASAIAVAGIAMLYTGVVLTSQLAQSLANERRLANAITVETSWDSKLEVNNSLFEMDSRNYFVKSAEGDIIRQQRPEGYLEAEPGSSVEFRTTLTYNTLDRDAVGIQRFEVRAYLEGFENIALRELEDGWIHDGTALIDPRPSDPDEWLNREVSASNGRSVYPGNGFGQMRVDIPENISPGVYTLVTETYAPATVSVQNEGKKEIRFPHSKVRPGHIVERERHPVIVGDVEHPMWVSHVMRSTYGSADPEVRIINPRTHELVGAYSNDFITLPDGAVIIGELPGEGTSIERELHVDRNTIRRDVHLDLSDLMEYNGKVLINQPRVARFHVNYDGQTVTTAHAPYIITQGIYVPTMDFFPTGSQLYESAQQRSEELLLAKPYTVEKKKPNYSRAGGATKTTEIIYPEPNL